VCMKFLLCVSSEGPPRNSVSFSCRYPPCRDPKERWRDVAVLRCGVERVVLMKESVGAGVSEELSH
jgi:hypothetical protein